MLFHISGTSGSGKTTIGKQLENIKNTVVIDTDDIDDKNALKILSDPQFTYLFENSKTINGFWNILDKKNNDTLLELLEKNKDKNIILVGMTVYPPSETGVIGYSINVSDDEIFYRTNKTELNTLCSNCKELKDLFDKEKNKYIISLKMLFEYKIRQSFPIVPSQITDNIEMRKKYDTDKGYKYLKHDEIIENIKKQIENNK